MDLTLKERLIHANISTQRACELFGRQERTLWNWNKDIPPYVLEIIKLHGSRHRMPEGWADWHFDRHWLVDPAGNAYKQNDIVSAHWNAKAYESLTGNKNEILNFKNELNKRLENNTVTVTVDTGKKVEKLEIAL